MASPTPTIKPELSITPASGSKNVRPDASVKVALNVGTLSSVSVKDSKGAVLPGKLSSDKLSWANIDNLNPKLTYTVIASGTGTDGSKVSEQSTFSTLTPSKNATFYLSPSKGSTVGVGMPIVASFLSPVDESKRAEIEKGMKVTTSPVTKGSWGWLSSTYLVWRPEKYWKPGTKVSLNADVGGMQTQSTLWTSGDDATNFTVGSAVIGSVDLADSMMTVRRDGQVLRSIPISAGKSGFTTRSGIKIVHEKYRERVMNSETTGIPLDSPEGYRTKVDYALRLTWSGEFLHAAPWNGAYFGSSNRSHGCTGMSDSNAAWLYENTRVGDVFQYTGSSRPMELGNGYGMWNVSFASWQKQSALV
ncbi:MAG: Ig-like domain-containing protein [Angustibacter sp.]